LIFRSRKIKSDPVSGERGFTLLEVIVALGIVTVGILAVSKAMSGHANTLLGSEERMIGYWVAANQLEYARIIKTIPVAGENRGRVDMADRTWFYREATSPTADPRLFRVDINVFTDEKEEDQVGYLFGYLKRP